MADIFSALMSAAGVSTGNPNAWDISKAYYDPGADAGDISKAFYSGIAISVSAQETSPRAVFFKPDGTKMYVYGAAGDDVNEYDLSSPWLVSSASYVQNYVFAGEGQPGGLFFKPDGTKMYLIGQGIDRVDEFSLSTPWDISTASSSADFSVSAQDTSPEDVFFKPDGTKMYVVGGAGVDINEYDLSTAWDVSSASYLQNFSVSTNAPAPTSVSFLSDGTKMYVLSSFTNDEVVEYSLSTPWDVSSASYVQSFSVGSQETDPEGMFMRSDGSGFYVCGNTNDTVYQYTIGGFNVAAQDTQPKGLFFKPDGTKFYYAGDGDNAIDEYSLSTAWDLSSASFVQTLSVSARDTIPSDVFFKEDGTVMFLAGDANDKIYQYSLSVAWDISTASYVNDYAVDVAGVPSAPQGVFWRSDGTRMFTCVSSTVYQFNAGSPAWGVNISYSGISKNLSAQGVSDARSLFFQSDGLTMYVLDKTTLKVFQYSLSSAWDVSSASFVSSTVVGNEGVQPWGLFWRDDGTEFYVTNYTTDKVLNYKISPE